ncbi:MAG: hypothetical protein A2W11_00445 [Ignavibacteria bacterium RBG_16_35_7]|nr:MAG: hypothetical protein A2W11_00445 [Ignavibacteria bacterium RBG_16_35_7]
MDISKFPTDNLYKFIAIFGLVIFIVSYFYPTILYNKVLYQSAEINADLETLEQKITSQENLIKFLQKLSDKATNKNKDTIIKSLFEEKVKLTTFNNELQETKKKHYILTSKTDEWEHWADLALWSQVIGGLMMILGFYFWYFKLQRYQDIIIKNEAMKIKNETTNI